MKTFLRRFLPPVMWMVLIYAVSSLDTLPGPQTTDLVWWDYVLKKTAHMIEYGILFYLWQRAINWGKPLEKRTFWLSFLLVLTYSISDEVHQSFVPNRHPRLYDVGLDLLGAFLVYVRIVKAI